MDELINALKALVKETIEEGISEADISQKVEEAAEELDFESLVTDHVDLGDLVKEHVDFEDLANDAIACSVEEVVERQVRKLDWGTIIGREVNLTETIRESVDLTEIANEKMSEMLAKRWENSQKILDTYIEERLDVALRDKVEIVVEEKLTGSFHDIDRDLNEKLTKAVGPLMDEIAALKAQLAKPWWRKIFG
jgi:excinuclease UvrABC nuclease subunit